MNYRGMFIFYSDAFDLTDFEKKMTFHSKTEGDLEVYVLNDFYIIYTPKYICRFIYWSELLRYCEDKIKGV